MIFTEPRFILFFVIIFILYWSCPYNKIRKIFLLLCSYIFYSAWNWRFLFLILISTSVDYVVGVQLTKTNKQKIRKILLLTSLSVDLGILGFFKYFNFFAQSLSTFLQSLGVEVDYTYINIILPVGISFYTFQALSYTIDVYLGKIEPCKNPIDFALFIAFFPQLVAGPIVRAIDFIPQLFVLRKWTDVRVRACLLLFLAGFIKKACISDNLSPYADAYFQDPASFSTCSTHLAAILYSIQIYCDFSGYSDMAIACAGLLGYHFPVNFNFPYFAVNIADFWRRWHISLSSWLRDYLYIPLGGNRNGTAKTYRNLLLTMFLGGLWHGASWNFVIWGSIHGIALMFLRIVDTLIPTNYSKTKLKTIISCLVTYIFVCSTWILFRSSDFYTSTQILSSFFLINNSGTQVLWPFLWIYILILLAVHWIVYKNYLKTFVYNLPIPVFSLLYGVAWAIIMTWVNTSYRPFIYFQF